MSTNLVSSPSLFYLLCLRASGEDLLPFGCSMFHQPLVFALILIVALLVFALILLVALLPSPHLLSLLLNNYSDVIQCSYTQAEASSVGERPY